MAVQIVFDSVQQFEELVGEKDYDLAKTFVESMLQNMYSDGDKITIAEVYFEEEDYIYDFEVTKPNLIPNLKEFLPIYEREEDYEGCALIASAIKTLEDLA